MLKYCLLLLVGCGADYTSCPDLADPLDLAVVVDLAVPDLRTPPDLGKLVDMARGHDAATPKDMAIPKDMAHNVDMHHPADMSHPDMAACGLCSAAECSLLTLSSTSSAEKAVLRSCHNATQCGCHGHVTVVNCRCN